MHINRALREAGYIRIREELGMRRSIAAPLALLLSRIISLPTSTFRSLRMPLQ